MQNFAIDMGKKEEQKKIKNLLVEAITLLCRNGLQYETKFSVEALIGITLDDNDVVLININEKFSNDDCTEAYTPVNDKRRDEEAFSNQDSNKQISIKNENFDDHVNFNNDENFQNPENINDENNYFNSDSNNNNEDENDVQYDQSNTIDNQLTENTMYIKSESSECGDGNNWMMNNNDYNNLDLTDDNYQKNPKPHSIRQGPYSSQMRRRGRGRILSKSSGFQRVRQQNNHNFMPSHQSMSFSFQASTSHSSLQQPFLPPLQDEELFSPSSNNCTPTHQLKTKTKSKNSTVSGITPNSALGEVGRSVFACNFCSMTFTVAASLKEHVNGIHLQIKMFHCEMCGESFKWRSDLSKHRRIVCPFTAVQ